MVCINVCFYEGYIINSLNGISLVMIVLVRICIAGYCIGCIVLFSARSVFLARMREEWSRLGDEEKKAFKKDAVVYKQQPPQNEAEKIAYLRRVFSELNKLVCNTLEKNSSLLYSTLGTGVIVKLEK